MQVGVYRFRCDICGGEAEEPAMHPYHYGALLLRAGSNEYAILDTLQIEVADEVSELLHEALPKLKHKSRESAALFQAIAGWVCCDTSPDGKPYKIVGDPYCPTCECVSELWTRDDAPPVRMIDLPIATHTIWNRLAPEEKEQKLLSALGISDR